MQGDRGTAAYTNVPVGAGGTANYPASQKVNGTGGTANYPASNNGVGSGYHHRSGYGNEYEGTNVKSGYGVKSGYSGNGGGAYVQPTPVSYGPNGQPIVRKNHRLRNALLGTLAVCCCCVAL